MIPVLELPERQSLAEDQGWKKINEGASRAVFTHTDQPQVVLKIDIYGEDHNRMECDLWEKFAESAFSFSFTPVLGRSEDYNSILMKRMPFVFKWKEASPEMREAVYPAKKRDVIKIWMSEKGNMTEDFHVANWGFIMDDYGDLQPGPVIDYAGY